jgi:hypothetical protein
MPWQGLALINRLPQARVNCSLGGDGLHVRFAPGEAGAFDQRHHIAGPVSRSVKARRLA